MGRAVGTSVFDVKSPILVGAKIVLFRAQARTNATSKKGSLESRIAPEEA